MNQFSSQIRIDPYLQFNGVNIHSAYGSLDHGLEHTFSNHKAVQYKLMSSKLQNKMLPSPTVIHQNGTVGSN